MPSELIWLIFFLPLISFLVIVFITRPFPKISGYVTILAILGSFLLSVWTLFAVIGAPGHELTLPDINWLTVGPFTLHINLKVDSLTAIMLIVVTGVSLMVQIYSQGYMHGDPGYSRYFAFMSLFTMSMLGVVLAGNLLQVYVFWELVGLCSYLLIGFWFQRPSAAAAAKKAFVVTRFGDFGFLIGILFLYANAGTLDITELQNLAITGALAGTTLTWAAIGIFSGAVGKSAQFPLHVWLPDAMEGPTPVSALIHAATMVAAGVYLVARLFPVFEHSTQAMTTVAIIGGFTAIFAASMGLVMNDIKRVLAYSTLSQLGYMMLGLGVGGYVAGMFHLMNHAFYKALLFLGSGSVNHASGTFDMRQMGGLRKVMPWTYITFLIASLSLAGIPPFSGFWSKDEILADALNSGQYLLLVMALGAAFMTSFYIFRVMFMTFEGSYRGRPATEHGADSSHGDHSHGPHESPKVMVLPLVLLAIPSVLSGFANPPAFLSFLGIPAHWLADFMKTPVIAEVLGEHAEAEFNFGLAGISTLIAFAGIFFAYAIYGAKWVSAEALGRAFRPIYTTLYNKYWFDELYQAIVDYILLGISSILHWFDKNIVDGIVNGAARLTGGAGNLIRRWEAGYVQGYATAMFFGVLIIVGVFLILS